MPECLCLQAHALAPATSSIRCNRVFIRRTRAQEERFRAVTDGSAALSVLFPVYLLNLETPLG